MFAPTGSRSGASTPTPRATSWPRLRPPTWRRPDTAGTARVFQGDDDGGLTSTNFDGPWPRGRPRRPGDRGLQRGRPARLPHGELGPGHEHGVGAAQHDTLAGPCSPGTSARWGNGGQHDQRLRHADIKNAGDDTLRVRRTEFAGTDPDDFLKSSDSCTGLSMAPGGSCAINVRFAPTVAARSVSDAAAVRQHGRGIHNAFLSGVGAAPSSGGGDTGPQGPPGPPGRKVPRARPAPTAPTARTARQGRGA